MIILIDNREQAELDFTQVNLIMNNNFIDGVEHLTLKLGDYGARFKDGFIPPVFFERKSLNDLFGTLASKNYKRFKDRIRYAQDNNLKLIIIIEKPLMAVLKGCEYSKFEGYSMVLKLFTLWAKHNVGFVCCKNRLEMSVYIANTYIAIGKQYLKKLGKSRLR